MKRMLVWMAMAAGLATGQEAKILPLTLEQAVDLALAPEGAVRLQLAGELIRQAEAQQGLARAALLPGVAEAVTTGDGALVSEQVARLVYALDRAAATLTR